MKYHCLYGLLMVSLGISDAHSCDFTKQQVSENLNLLCEPLHEYVTVYSADVGCDLSKPTLLKNLIDDLEDEKYFFEPRELFIPNLDTYGRGVLRFEIGGIVNTPAHGGIFFVKMKQWRCEVSLISSKEKK